MEEPIRYRIVIELKATSYSLRWIKKALRHAISSYCSDYCIHEPVETSFVVKDSKNT